MNVQIDWAKVKQSLGDSSWFTVAWEWFQTLLGRVCDFVLWVTMIFACYQLIPGAPLPSPQVSVVMFVLQFVALDIGGLSLLQIARRRGLERWSYVCWIAYILIGITLITIAYSGIQHAVPGLNPQVIDAAKTVPIKAGSANLPRRIVMPVFSAVMR